MFMSLGYAFLFLSAIEGKLTAVMDVTDVDDSFVFVVLWRF